MQLEIWHRPPPQPRPPDAEQPARLPGWVQVTNQERPQPQVADGDGAVRKSTNRKPTQTRTARIILNETQRQGLLIYAQAIDAGEPTGKAIRDWGLMEESHVTELVRKTIQSGQLQELLQGWHSEHLLRDPKIVMALILQRRRSGKPKA